MQASKHPGSGRQKISLHQLFMPIPIDSLVAFRLGFGLVLLAEVIMILMKGRIEQYWVDPPFHFSYYGFDWVRPWPVIGMYIHVIAAGVATVCVALGFWYRLSAVALFLLAIYFFLLDQAYYLNHMYLVCLLCFLMVFVPAHRAFSLDTKRRPARHTTTVPAWSLWLLRFQMSIVYVYGGLAKLNNDWLHGWPLHIWLRRRQHFPIFGPLFEQEWVVYFFSYSSLLFDLLVVPLLLWRKSRPFAFGFAIVFHLTNAMLFSIGIFPWLSLTATLLFFSPEWPRKLLVRLRIVPGSDEHAPGQIRRRAAHPEVLSGRQRMIVGFLLTYLLIQVLVPFRHVLYPGNVSWTEEGHHFSWRMMLRGKRGSAQFKVTDPDSGKTWKIKLRDYLNRRQIRKMRSRPEMILLFSHYLAQEKRKEGYPHVEVRARVWLSLNGRKYQFLINPTVDLAAQPRSLKPAPWIVPLHQPLRRRSIRRTRPGQ